MPFTAEEILKSFPVGTLIQAEGSPQVAEVVPGGLRGIESPTDPRFLQLGGFGKVQKVDPGTFDLFKTGKIFTMPTFGVPVPTGENTGEKQAALGPLPAEAPPGSIPTNTPEGFTQSQPTQPVTIQQDGGKQLPVPQAQQQQQPVFVRNPATGQVAQVIPGGLKGFGTPQELQAAGGSFGVTRDVTPEQFAALSTGERKVEDLIPGGGFKGAESGEPRADILDLQKENTDANLNKYGVTKPDTAENPVTAFGKLYKQMLDSLGFSDVKSRLAEINKEYADLQNKKIDEIAAINDNPWLNEGLRSRNVQKVNDKYEEKLNALDRRLSVFKDIDDDIRSEAQFVANQAMDSYYRERTLDQNMLLRKMELAERAAAKKEGTADIQEYEFARGQGYKGSFLEFQRERRTRETTTSDIQEYEFAREQGYKGSFLDWQREKANLKQGRDGKVSTVTQRRDAKVFSQAQINKGSAVAGIPIADFEQLEEDTQNFFINNADQVNTVKRNIVKAKAENGDPRQIEADISNNDSLPPAAKDTLVRYVWSIFPRPPENSLPWWRRILPGF